MTTSPPLFPPVTLERAGRPLYRQLYDWFQSAILTGRLQAGQRVPSTRSLALDLGISRIPVLNAYEQLHAEGYLRTLSGSGTYVAKGIPDEAPARPPQRTASPRPPRLSQCAMDLLTLGPQPGSSSFAAFRVSLPALARFPLPAWSRLVTRNARRQSIAAMAYADPMGHLPLRKAIADYLATVRGVHSEPAQIMIVTGSQQGLQISARALLNRGDAVWIEDPGYPGARQALTVAGARLIPVPVDGEGLQVDYGIRRCRTARAAYVTPSHQYPMGMTMSVARRMSLLNWATRAGAWIIEDDYDSEFRYGSRPIAALQGLDAEDRTIYIGTFSKVLFPALRIGYIIVPRSLLPAFRAVREAADIFSSSLYQDVVLDFMTEGHFARHIRRMRGLYMERRLILIAEIKKQLGGKVEIVSAEAGMHLVVLLPAGVSDVAVSEAAAALGVAAMPLSACYAKPPARGGLILGYGATDASMIRVGVRKLASAIRASL